MKIKHVDNCRSQVTQGYRFLDNTRGYTAWGDDQQGNVQFSLVETCSMAENTEVLTEAFPMVRRYDQPGSVQYTLPLELVEQLPDLFIKIGNAVIISINGKRKIF